MSGSEGGNWSAAEQRVNSQDAMRAHSLHECGYQKSKLPQASLRPFHFLTANPGKPGSVSRAGATENWDE